ncbi:9863_t:CDS:2, partial [Dentiscutata erythropus]
SKRSTAEKFNITPKQLREWIKKKQELKNAPPCVRRLNIGGRAKYPLLEVDLKTWVKSLRSRQKIVSRYMVKTKASQLAKQPRFLSLYPMINECKWSYKWVDGFMRRNNFSNRRRTTVAQRLPEDLEPKRDEFLMNVPRQVFPSGIVVRTNRSGYMNSDEMIFWIENIWNRRAPLSINPRSLLVLDAFSGHLTDSVKNRFNEKNTNMAVIPEGLTKKLQPLDVYINKSFKDK